MIEVTQSAATMVRKIMAREGREHGVLRLAVQGGGCNGFSYRMQFEDAPRDTDQKFHFHDLDVVVDPKSLEYLQNITLDYVEGLNARFEWRNPNATRTCSCGESFDVQ